MSSLFAVGIAEMGHCGGWVDRVAMLRYNGVETIDGIGCVVHDTEGAVRLDETVLTLDEVSVTVFCLGFNVTGQGVSHSVVV